MSKAVFLQDNNLPLHTPLRGHIESYQQQWNEVAEQLLGSPELALIAQNIANDLAYYLEWSRREFLMYHPEVPTKVPDADNGSIVVQERKNNAIGVTTYLGEEQVTPTLELSADEVRGLADKLYQALGLS